MAVQKSRKSRSRRDMKRSPRDVLTAAALSTDPTTGEVHRRHHVTAKGFYRGRQIVDMAKAKTVDHDHDHDGHDHEHHNHN